MNITLQRWVTLPKSSLGGLTINEDFQCFSLEDGFRAVKVPGETRIPAGTYQLALRTEGKMHDSYARRFTDHRGMIWLQDVPDFEWVYLHCGNTPDDTEGCILVGDSLQASGRILDSVQAYRRIYGLVSNAILAGEPVSITVGD